MIQPTIRCAHPDCACQVPMPEAMRVGTRLYCSFRCANDKRASAAPAPAGRSLLSAIRDLHALAG